MQKCPLCGGKLDKNYCDSCGYTVPDENELSAPYNMDPSDDYPEPVREITPEHITDEIYPNRPEPVEFKVRGEYEQPAQQPFVNPYANSNNGAAGQGQTGQPFNNTPVPPSQNPYANGNFTPYTNFSNSANGNIGEFIKKYWIILLIMLLAPRIISFILGVSMLRSVGRENKAYTKYMFIAIIITCVFSL